MVNLIKILFKLINVFERENPPTFWLLIGCFGFWISPFHLETSVLTKSQQSQSVIAKNIWSVSSIGRGGVIGIGKIENFDLAFHHRLEQHFPDWEERMDYQKKQDEFYKSAMGRRKEIKRLGILDNTCYYTKEELDAIDYFQGSGFYTKQQDPKVKPNVFGTRQSLLLKMHDPILRENFLKNFNRKNNLKS